MVLKIINATEVKVGTHIIYNEMPCTVKSIDISKTGKHGHAKCRIEAVGMLTGQKKVFVIPGHDKLEVPMVNKRKGQVLSVGDKISVMDLESFETIDILIPEGLKKELKDGDQIEYWDAEGSKIIKRKI